MRYEKILDMKVYEMKKIIENMQEALEFYANEKNWEDTNEIYTGDGMVSYSNISVDGGEFAQKVLIELKEFEND